jgi:hypothetical protein
LDREWERRESVVRRSWSWVVGDEVELGGGEEGWELELEKTSGWRTVSW